MKNNWLIDGNVVRIDVVNKKIYEKNDSDVIKLKVFENGGYWKFNSFFVDNWFFEYGLKLEFMFDIMKNNVV